MKRGWQSCTCNIYISFQKQVVHVTFDMPVIPFRRSLKATEAGNMEIRRRKKKINSGRRASEQPRRLESHGLCNHDEAIRSYYCSSWQWSSHLENSYCSSVWDFSIYSLTNLGEGAILGIEIHPLPECSTDSNARMYPFPKSTKLLEIKVSNYLDLVNLEHWQLQHKVKRSSSST